MPRSTARLVAIFSVLAGVLIGAAPAQADWPLRGYWPLLEGRGQTIYDISGMGNEGRLGKTNGVDGKDAEWVPGLFGVGKALRLDGDDFVVVPEAKSLRPAQVTVEMWAKAPKSPGQYKYLVSKGGDRCVAGSFGLYTSINGGAAFYVYDGKRFRRSPMVSQAVWDGKWHHLAGVYDGKAIRLYVDGRQIGTGTPFSGAIEYDLEHRALYLGAYRGACDLTFAGDVDEIRVWSAPLSVDAIWNRISGFLGVEPAAPMLPEDAGAWYDAAT